MTDSVNGWRPQRPTEKENFTPVKTSVRGHDRPTDIAKLGDFKSSQLGTNLKSKCETFEKFGNLADKPVNCEIIDKKCLENDNNIKFVKSVKIVSRTSKETNLPQRHLYSANMNFNVKHQTELNQTIQNQPKPNQTTPNHTKSNQKNREFYGSMVLFSLLFKPQIIQKISLYYE